MESGQCSSPPYACPYDKCVKSFSKKSRLHVHVRIHTGERPFACDVAGCEKSYLRKMHLDRHVESVHQKKVPVMLRCGLNNCTKTFATKCGLDKHVKSHIEPGNYVCVEIGCEETFRKKHQLRAHSFEHKGVMPYECTYEGCHKKFRQTSHLQCHQKAHKPYPCDEEGCSLIFNKWSQLRSHKASEHKRKHTCVTCGKTFQRPGLLDNHIKLHDNVRKFKCPNHDCLRTYSELKNLTAHIRSYHEGKKVKCEECGKECVNNSTLKHHQQRFHQNISLLKKSYPNKGHRRKPVCAKLLNHIMNTCSPVLDMDLPEIETLTVKMDSACVEQQGETENESRTQQSDCDHLNKDYDSDSEIHVCDNSSTLVTKSNVGQRSVLHESDEIMQCNSVVSNISESSASYMLLDPLTCKDEIVSIVPLHKTNSCTGRIEVM